MKTLSVKTTIMPEGNRITWANGMPKSYTRKIETKAFNKWAEYIHNQVRMWAKNKIKPGGICHSEGQESALRQAKELLK